MNKKYKLLDKIYRLNKQKKNCKAGFLYRKQIFIIFYKL